LLCRDEFESSSWKNVRQVLVINLGFFERDVDTGTRDVAPAAFCRHHLMASLETVANWFRFVVGSGLGV